MAGIQRLAAAHAHDDVAALLGHHVAQAGHLVLGALAAKLLEDAGGVYGGKAGLDLVAHAALARGGDEHQGLGTQAGYEATQVREGVGALDVLGGAVEHFCHSETFLEVWASKARHAQAHSASSQLNG